MKSTPAAPTEFDEANRPRRVVIVELVAVVSFLYLYLFVGKFVKGHADAADPGALYPLYVVLYQLGRVLPLLYIVWLADGSLRRLGWTRIRWYPHLLFGLGLFACRWLMSYTTRGLFHGVPWMKGSPDPDRYALIPLGWLAAYVVISVATQELFYRGFLVSRLRELFGNYWAPILISALMFASVHIDFGPRHVLLTFLAGIMYALAFASTKSIWPSVLAHLIWNSYTLWFQELLHRASRSL